MDVRRPARLRPAEVHPQLGVQGSTGREDLVDRANLDLPEQFRSPVPTIANAYQTVGLAFLAYGLVDLNLLATVAGILIVHGGKLWYIDRAVLLFADMKGRDSKYAAWDYTMQVAGSAKGRGRTTTKERSLPEKAKEVSVEGAAAAVGYVDERTGMSPFLRGFLYRKTPKGL